MKKQNVTLSLPKDLLKEPKIIAIKQDKSLSRLLTDALEAIVQHDQQYQKARVKHQKMLRKGFSMGTRGQLKITRDEIHERH